MICATSPLNLPLLRQERGISLEQIAETTKISMLSLRAIEAEAWDQLPGGIYATSYLRQYAAAVGIDHSPLLRRHAEVANAHRHEPPPRGMFDRWFRPYLQHRA